MKKSRSSQPRSPLLFDDLPVTLTLERALAAQTLLRTQQTISALRGHVYRVFLNDREIALVPTFNPAYVLRVAEKKREAWADLKLVRDLLSG